VHSAEAESVGLNFAPVRTRSLTWTFVDWSERLVAGLVFATVLPALAASTLLIFLLCRRSPLVAHQRIGIGGRTLWILKLRTMWGYDCPKQSFLIEYLRAPELPQPVPKTACDRRVTSRFAAFCRRYSIDELPQLLQVIRGELALVGPRPLTRPELDAHYGTRAAELLVRKPGLTGLWQISGRSRLTYAQRRRLDLFMLRKWSLALYFKILLTTVPRVIGGKDAW
jgi:exopolysaccharide production protein ExoY